MVYKQKTSKHWWYKFKWNGEWIRESTKQPNKGVARQIESARRTALAKGEVGIREKRRAPTLSNFAEHDFLPFVRTTSKEKPRTIVFYETTVKNLKSHSKLADTPLDGITSEIIVSFIAKRQALGMRVSTINRDLQTLRRMFKLAQEWEKVSSVLPRVRMLPGENRRDRVLTGAEEAAYLKAATELGENIEADYQRALKGIRAIVRGEQPQRPDAYLLRDIATMLIDCGLRPEECFRLTWENVRDNAVEIFKGKRAASRRRVPATARVLALLEMRKAFSNSEWIFPARTKSGHVETSTLKKQHSMALRASKVSPFVPYDFRHTCLTRWAKALSPFTLKILAGHADLNTTMHYVHLNDDDVRAALAKVQSGHTSRHTRADSNSAVGLSVSTTN